MGHKLEVIDHKEGKAKLRAATVLDVLGNRILVHCDGSNINTAQWIFVDSPKIQPRDYHKKSPRRFVFEPPQDAMEFYDAKRKEFDWMKYLKKSKSTTAPGHAFPKSRKTTFFKSGMKIELVDKLTPSLIRPATIVQWKSYAVRVVFDGLDDDYAYWIDIDDPDMHPVNWCVQTGYKLEFPLSK